MTKRLEITSIKPGVQMIGNVEKVDDINGQNNFISRAVGGKQCLRHKYNDTPEYQPVVGIIRSSTNPKFFCLDILYILLYSHSTNTNKHYERIYLLELPRQLAALTVFVLM